MSDDWRPDLQEVMEFYGARVLSGRGPWQKATCPLSRHDDQSPSASVNVDAGKWRCFSCDVAGDVYDLIGENEGVGFLGAREFAAANFERRDDGVRGGPVSRSGLPLRSRPGRRKGGTWVPPWSLS